MFYAARTLCVCLCGACSSVHTNATQTACECEEKKWRKLNEAWKSLCTSICEAERENIQSTTQQIDIMC